MANADALKALRKSGLSAPPTSGAGNVEPQPNPELGQAQSEPAAEAPAPKKKSSGRPPLDYRTRQLGARVRLETFDRVTAISRRERVGLGPLVDRMVAAWERQRLAEAEAVGPRREGEDDDAYIARIFKL